MVLWFILVMWFYINTYEKCFKYDCWYYYCYYWCINLRKIFKAYYGFRVLYVFPFPSAGHWPMGFGSWQSRPIIITILSLPCLLVVENRTAMAITAASRQRRQRQAIGELVGGGDSGVIRAISGDIPKAWSLGNINPKVNQLISLILIFNFVDFG